MGNNSITAEEAREIYTRSDAYFQKLMDNIFQQIVEAASSGKKCIPFPGVKTPEIASHVREHLENLHYNLKDDPSVGGFAICWV